MNSPEKEVPPHFFLWLKQHHFLRQNTIIFASQYLKRSEDFSFRCKKRWEIRVKWLDKYNEYDII